MYKLKLAVVAGTVGALGISLLAAGPAFADYAPSNNDTVAVGSDTLQFAGDFVADGDANGIAGYNSTGNPNKFVNFDAIPDANARLAYGEAGATGFIAVPTSTVSNVVANGTDATITTAAAHGLVVGGTVRLSGLTTTALNGDWTVKAVPSTTTFTFAKASTISSVADSGSLRVVSSGVCDPGTGTTAGNANSTLLTNTGNGVCQLNPTIVLRAGTKPVQRPNGSTAGVNALAADIAAGTRTVDAARSSSNKDSSFAPGTVHRITIGTEVVAMVAKQSGNMPPTGLTTDELTSIYSQNLGSCKTWKAVLEARTAVTINNVALTSNVATITTAAVHKVLAGSQVTISSLTNTDLNGTYTVASVPSTTTFTFAKTAANIVSVADSGSFIQTGSSDTIEPLIPQAGSGTRSYFVDTVAKGGIAVSTVGTCAIVSEENDPTAAVANINRTGPISGARLNLFLGKNGAGSDVTAGKYFLDPSCSYGSASVSGVGSSPACGTAAAGSEQVSAATGLNSTTATTGALTLDTSKVYTVATTGGATIRLSTDGGTTFICDNSGSVYPFNISSCSSFKFKPSTSSVTITSKSSSGNITALSVKSVANSVPTPSTVNISVNFYTSTFTSSLAYSQTRSLYIYIPDSGMNDVVLQTQPGINKNKIRDIFANPCSGTGWGSVAYNGVAGEQGCAVSGGNLYGSGGRPYFATSGGQSLISSSGITASYSFDF